MGEPRAEKVAVVDEVETRLRASNGAILTEYRGLTVAEMAALRRALREAGGQYKVYKNTLVRRAVREIGLEDLEPLLTGPTAITFVEADVSAVAKVLRDFSRIHQSLIVKGGLVGRDLLDARATASLADLPSREVLLAQLAGAMAAPLRQLAGLLQALPRNLAYGLRALIDTREGDAGAGPAPGAPAEAAEPGETEAKETAEAADTETQTEARETAEAADTETPAETAEAGATETPREPAEARAPADGGTAEEA